MIWKSVNIVNKNNRVINIITSLIKMAGECGLKSSKCHPTSWSSRPAVCWNSGAPPLLWRHHDSQCQHLLHHRVGQEAQQHHVIWHQHDTLPHKDVNGKRGWLVDEGERSGCPSLHHVPEIVSSTCWCLLLHLRNVSLHQHQSRHWSEDIIWLHNKQQHSSKLWFELDQPRHLLLRTLAGGLHGEEDV